MDLKKLGCGGFLTEFGAMGDTETSIENLGFLTTLADSYLQSWTYWQFKSFNDITTAGPAESFYNGDQLEESKVKVLSRTYAQSIAGVPQSMEFNPNHGEFQLAFIPTSTQPTEIFLNEKYYYSNGFQVKMIPENAGVWKKVKQIIIN